MTSFAVSFRLFVRFFVPRECIWQACSNVTMLQLHTTTFEDETPHQQRYFRVIKQKDEQNFCNKMVCLRFRSFVMPNCSHHYTPILEKVHFSLYMLLEYRATTVNTFFPQFHPPSSVYLQDNTHNSVSNLEDAIFSHPPCMKLECIKSISSGLLRLFPIINT